MRVSDLVEELLVDAVAVKLFETVMMVSVSDGDPERLGIETVPDIESDKASNELVAVR